MSTKSKSRNKEKDGSKRKQQTFLGKKGGKPIKKEKVRKKRHIHVCTSITQKRVGGQGRSGHKERNGKGNRKPAFTSPGQTFETTTHKKIYSSPRRDVQFKESNGPGKKARHRA